MKSIRFGKAIRTLLLPAILILSAVYAVFVITPMVRTQVHLITEHSITTESMPIPIKRTTTELTSINHQKNTAEPFAALVSACFLFLTLLAAILGYLEASHTQSRSKTLDFLNRQAHDQQLIEMFKKWREFRKSIEADPTPLSVKCVSLYYAGGVQSDSAKKNYEICIDVLNYYEIWAIGISNSALEESMLKQWWRTSLVADVTDLLPFIYGYQHATKVEKAFVEAERLASSWALQTEREQIKQAKAAFNTDRIAYEKEKKLAATAAKNLANTRVRRRDRGFVRAA